MKLFTCARLIITPVVAVALVGGGYFGVYSRLPWAGPGPAPVLVEYATAKTPVVDVKSKSQAVLVPKEYVVIGEHRFEVFAPWLGHRLAGVVDPQDLDFAMLPPELAFEGRKIYVTVATRDAFVKMAAAAALDGVNLLVDSGYRSAAYQRRIYQIKMAEGDTFYDIARGVAPPGYSEHMLGTTIDLVPSRWDFNGTPAEKWLLKNGADFAFVQSYPQKSDLGFTWEPWHWKYVGDS